MLPNELQLMVINLSEREKQRAIQGIQAFSHNRLYKTKPLGCNTPTTKITDQGSIRFLYHHPQHTRHLSCHPNRSGQRIGYNVVGAFDVLDLEIKILKLESPAQQTLVRGRHVG